MFSFFKKKKEQKYIKEKDLKDNPSPISMDKMLEINEQMTKCICDINCLYEGHGTGFFCKIPFPTFNQLLSVLITNNHVLEEKDIAPGSKINYTLNKKTISKRILIDKSRKTYTSKLYDITIIEIKDEDDLKEDQFFYIDPKINNENFDKEFSMKDVYIIGNIYYFTTGKIWNISLDSYLIKHKCSTQSGMSGSPIINLSNYKVIGVHKGADPKEFNLGTFISKPIKEFNEKFSNLKDNVKEKINNIKFNINEEEKEESSSKPVEIKINSGKGKGIPPPPPPPPPSKIIGDEKLPSKFVEISEGGAKPPMKMGGGGGRAGGDFNDRMAALRARIMNMDMSSISSSSTPASATPSKPIVELCEGNTKRMDINKIINNLEKEKKKANKESSEPVEIKVVSGKGKGIPLPPPPPPPPKIIGNEKLSSKPVEVSGGEARGGFSAKMAALLARITGSGGGEGEKEKKKANKESSKSIEIKVVSGKGKGIPRPPPPPPPPPKMK